MKTIAVALASIGLSVAAQFCLKAGMSGAHTADFLEPPFNVRGLLGVLTDPFVLLGFLLYGTSAIAWLAVLSKWEVSKAYPLVGLGFVMTAVIGLLAGEHVTTARAIGVSFVCAGVWMIART
jgi:multidrug transporter EmrE-like cation transporter